MNSDAKALKSRASGARASEGDAGTQREYAKNQAAICLGKTGGRCWYCGERLYYRDEADTEFQKRLVFTADHLHPRAHGGRGRANKVPACKYCNSHKSSRTVEQFRQWVQALVFDKAKRDGAPLGEQGLGRWKITAGAVIFYFELARLSNNGSQLLLEDGAQR